MAHELAALLHQRLSALGDETRAEKHKAYLKSALTHRGVDVPGVRAPVKATSAEHALGRAELIALVEQLWDRGIYELQLGLMVTTQRHPPPEPEAVWARAY